MRRSVVYLESAPALAFPDVEPQRATMDQRNETFVPHVLAITVGTTVDFPNSDNNYHNVFSLRGPRPFDLGRYAAGRSKSVRFDRPGIVRVFCEIHSHMSAFILVFNHRYFAVTTADGRYQMAACPPAATRSSRGTRAPSASRERRDPRRRGRGGSRFQPAVTRGNPGIAHQPDFSRSAALAVVSIATAVYFVSRTTTPRPKPSCSGVSSRRARWSTSNAPPWSRVSP